MTRILTLTPSTQMMPIRTRTPSTQMMPILTQTLSTQMTATLTLMPSIRMRTASTRAEVLSMQSPKPKEGATNLAVITRLAWPNRVQRILLLPLSLLRNAGALLTGRKCQ